MNSKIASTVRAIAQEEYTHETRKLAIRLGFVDEFERRGISSEEAGQAIIAFSNGNDPNQKIASMATTTAVALIAAPLVAGIIGDFTGQAHHNIERELDKKNDVDLIRAKIKRRAMERVAIERGGFGPQDSVESEESSAPESSRRMREPVYSPSESLPQKKKDTRMVELLD
jgi:hypothetical protein